MMIKSPLEGGQRGVLKPMLKCHSCMVPTKIHSAVLCFFNTLFHDKRELSPILGVHLQILKPQKASEINSEVAYFSERKRR